MFILCCFVSLKRTSEHSHNYGGKQKWNVLGMKLLCILLFPKQNPVHSYSCSKTNGIFNSNPFLATRAVIVYLMWVMLPWTNNNIILMPGQKLITFATWSWHTTTVHKEYQAYLTTIGTLNYLRGSFETICHFMTINWPTACFNTNPNLYHQNDILVLFCFLSVWELVQVCLKWSFSSITMPRYHFTSALHLSSDQSQDRLHCVPP